MDITPIAHSDNAAHGIAWNLLKWYRASHNKRGTLPTLLDLIGKLWEFARDSTPARRKQRYGDIEYDWENRVDTTSATIGWRDRLLGLFHSPYQPTEPELFREMLESLPIDFSQFTFIDIGSGKGRTLLMASDFPFRRIVGVELFPELHRVAQENLRKYKTDSQQCPAIETLCLDATEFVFPPEPIIVYLFNPLPQAGLRQLMVNLERSLQEDPRPAYIIYHNPQLAEVITASLTFQKTSGTHQYSIFRRTA